MDLVLEAGLLVLGVSDEWIWAEVVLVLVLFSEFFLDLMAEGVVGLDVARVWVKWFISWLTSFFSCDWLNFGPLVFSTAMMLSKSMR